MSSCPSYLKVVLSQWASVLATGDFVWLLQTSAHSYLDLTYLHRGYFALASHIWGFHDFNLLLCPHKRNMLSHELNGVCSSFFLRCGKMMKLHSQTSYMQSCLWMMLVYRRSRRVCGWGWWIWTRFRCSFIGRCGGKCEQCVSTFFISMCLPEWYVCHVSLLTLWFHTQAQIPLILNHWL